MAAPADLKSLHQKSRHHRAALAQSAVCACFYCLNEYRFDRIKEWIDDGQTAICPICGVDAVIGFDAAIADQDLLRKLHKRWFERPKRLTPDEWTKALSKDAWEKPK